MNTKLDKRILHPVASLLGFSLCATLPVAHAQWIGAGAGGEGTDFNDPANWVGGAINGKFTGNTSSATVTLDGDVTVPHLDFRWGTSGISLGIDGTGTINVGGTVYVQTVAQEAGSPVTIGAGVTLNLGEITGLRSFGGSQAVGDLVVHGAIAGTASGSGVIRFNGGDGNRRTITLTNDNSSFDSPIEVQEGVLKFTSVSSVNGGNSALGHATSEANGTITLMRNSTLEYIGSADQTTDRILRSGAVNNTDITLRHSGSGGTLTYQSDFDLGNGTSQLLLFAMQESSTIRFDGVISAANTASIKINDNGSANGKIVFANEANTYTGYTEIHRGILEVTKLADAGEESSIGKSSNDIGGNPGLRFGSWGNATPVLRYVGTGDSTDRLFLLRRSAKLDSSGVGALKFTNTGGLTYGTANNERLLVLGGTNTDDNTFAISLADPGVGSNKTRLNKVDSGKWILTGTNTYTGATSISGGTLLVHGTLQSEVQVNVGAFGGTGSTTQAVTIGNDLDSRDALLLAGVGTGGFSSDGALTFASDGEYVFTFDSGLAAGEAARANGVSISSSAWFTFVDIGTGDGIAVDDSFIILENTGASSISGSFANLAQDDTFTVNGITWRADYFGGDGNDLALTVVSFGQIPEPGSAALLIGAAGLLSAGVRRRRHGTR
jgi:autotransporter-associated beta strand repeat